MIVITLALAVGPALQAAGDSYAAIAFSPSTGRWGYGNAHVVLCISAYR